MKEIKEFIVKIYSNLLDESMNSWLKSEDVVMRMEKNPEEKILLRDKIKNISNQIANDFADKIIKEGFPNKDISPQKVKKILNQVIERYAEELKK